MNKGCVAIIIGSSLLCAGSAFAAEWRCIATGVHCVEAVTERLVESRTNPRGEIEPFQDPNPHYWDLSDLDSNVRADDNYTAVAEVNRRISEACFGPNRGNVGVSGGTNPHETDEHGITWEVDPVTGNRWRFTGTIDFKSKMSGAMEINCSRVGGDSQGVEDPGLSDYSGDSQGVEDPGFTSDSGGSE